MRKQILEALKAKFEGVSEKVLGRIADRLANTVTTAEEVKTAVDGVTFQQVLDSYGDSRATEAQQTAVQNYEKKYGLKDGKAVGADTAEEHNNSQPTGNGDDEMPAWAKAIIESNKALGEQVKAMQGERVTANRREQLSQIISSLPASIRKAYERTPVDTLTDEEFETLKADITAEAADIAKETAARGAVFGRPSVQGGTKTQQTSADNGGKEATDDEAKAVVDKLGI